MTPENVPNLWEYLDQFQKSMAEIHGSLTDPREKAALGELLTQLQGSRAEVEKLVPPLIETMHKESVALKAQAEQAVAELKRQQAELPARLEEIAQSLQPPAPAAPAEAALDPDHSVELSAELLQRFGGPQAAPRADVFEGEGSVAAAWVDPAETEAARAARPRTPPPAPKAPRPHKPSKRDDVKPQNPDDDAWEGLSRMED